MLYYVDDLTETIKFYHSLLKNNGRLMIVIETGKLNWILCSPLPAIQQFKFAKLRLL